MLTKYFKAEELLPKGVTDTSLLKPNLLQLIDEVREILGVPCSINNYAKGGTRQWCGLRTEACKQGTPRSQHRIGNAADLHPVGLTADEARAKLKAAVAEGKLKNLGGVEEGVSWVHVDARPRVNGKVLYFKA